MFRSLLGHVSRWKERICYALLDQACTSASSLVLTVLVARSVPIESFGAYALVWFISMSCDTISNSLVNDPIPAIFSEKQHRYRSLLLTAASWINLSVAAILSLAILGTAILISNWSREIGFQLGLLAVVNPLLRFQQFIRRLCYLEDRQAVAAAASFFSAATLLGGATVLFGEELLSAPAAVLLWGLGASATILTGLASGSWRPGGPRFRMIIALARRLWSAGRWLLGANLASWINNLGMLPLAAIYVGPAAAGILRALQTLFVPLTLGNAAINTMLLPRLAEIAAGRDRNRLRPFVCLTLCVYAFVALTYVSVILVEFREPSCARLSQRGNYGFRRPALAVGARVHHGRRNCGRRYDFIGRGAGTSHISNSSDERARFRALRRRPCP